MTTRSPPKPRGLHPSKNWGPTRLVSLVVSTSELLRWQNFVLNVGISKVFFVVLCFVLFIILLYLAMMLLFVLIVFVVVRLSVLVVVLFWISVRFLCSKSSFMV